MMNLLNLHNIGYMILLAQPFVSLEAGCRFYTFQIGKTKKQRGYFLGLLVVFFGICFSKTRKSRGEVQHLGGLRICTGSLPHAARGGPGAAVRGAADTADGDSEAEIRDPHDSQWPWGITGITFGSILGWMNVHSPPILMFTRGTGF